MMIYDYDPENAIINLRASGVLVADDPIRYFQRLAADPAFRPRAEERVYFTDLIDIKFSYHDIVAIRNAYQENHHGDKLSQVVFITDSELSFGMARMVISVFGGVFPDTSITRLDRA